MNTWHGCARRPKDSPPPGPPAPQPALSATTASTLPVSSPPSVAVSAIEHVVAKLQNRSISLESRFYALTLRIDELAANQTYIASSVSKLADSQNSVFSLLEKFTRHFGNFSLEA